MTSLVTGPVGRTFAALADRGSIELSSTAGTSMLWLFPALRSIIEKKLRIPENDNCRLTAADRFNVTDSPKDVLTGMADFFNGLCEYGPVMLVIDNFQWIDRDSVDLLNRLLAEVNGSLGLVTISTNETTPLYCSPNRIIALKPLNEQQTARLIENMVDFGIPQISSRVVQLIARSGRDNANELCQMLVELASKMNETNLNLHVEQHAAEVSNES